jgi:alginate O-acetyltransferase complex protein AlgI
MGIHHQPLLPAKSWFCWVGVAHAFLPLGISFFTFEFIHYATDRYESKTEAGNIGEYLAFILFFSTVVAGPIKRYQQFLPKLRSEPSRLPNDWHPGITRILAGLAKNFAIADVLTAISGTPIVLQPGR